MSYRVIFYHEGEEPSGVDCGSASIEEVERIIIQTKEISGYNPQITIISDNNIVHKILIAEGATK